MSTKTDVKPEGTETATTDAPETNTMVDKLLADSTIVADKVIIKLITEIDNVETKMGGKWYNLIVHCKTAHLSDGTDEEIKAGKQVVLKTLLSMGKTLSSAYSIRTQIFKMSKPEFAEALEKLKLGQMTVREAREFGRKPQSNPSLSNEEKYKRALNDAVRYSVVLGITKGKFGDDAEKAFAEYYANNTDKTEPTALKS